MHYLANTIPFNILLNEDKETRLTISPMDMRSFQAEIQEALLCKNCIAPEAAASRLFEMMSGEPYSGPIISLSTGDTILILLATERTKDESDALWEELKGCSFYMVCIG